MIYNNISVGEKMRMLAKIFVLKLHLEGKFVDFSLSDGR